MAQGAEGRQVEIVLVEDEHADALLVERALRRAGIAGPVTVLTDGERALDDLLGRSAEHLPGLILLDLKLPRIDGLTVLRRIKGTPGLRRVPVVILTSSAQARDVRAAYDLGANSYLVKPSRFSDLCLLAEQVEAYWIRRNKAADGILS
ncbi:MAG: response regulator [Deltaproteobacteria bacterium]|nr:MAG: response regulator [Deltaproteobacteria bacterium]